MLEYLPLDIISASRLIFSLEPCFWKTFWFLEQIYTMSVDKDLSIFSDQMKVIAYSTYFSGKWMENLYTNTSKNLILMDTSVKLLKDAAATTCIMAKRELNLL